MMAFFKRMLPDALAGRIVLLLAVTILAANLIALAVLTFQQQRFDRQASQDRRIERIAALVPALEAVDAQTRQVIAQNASTRFARVRVGTRAMVTETGSDDQSIYIANGLRQALEREDVSVGIINRSGRANNVTQNGRARRERSLAVTIPLTIVDGQTEWVNVVMNDAPRRRGPVDSKPFLTVLALSLLGVLSVSILLARHLTKPLSLLSGAARAAGRGDRSARVPEAGALEMREAAQAFNAMQGQISQFDAERMRMFAAVGHDLRTPMTSLRIRAEMIDDTDQRDAMIRTLDEMAVMADGLVSYAKSGQDGESVAVIDLGELLRQLCKDRGAVCEADQHIELAGRRVALVRAIGNIVDNANRYGEQATVRLSQEGENAVITIEDTGPGIPPDRMDDVLQPFNRGDNSRSVDTGGAGLGLSIARTLIAAHGGRLALENRKKGGLRVTVTLPLSYKP